MHTSCRRRAGDTVITLVRDGYFRLDGGAMFGVVPRLLWEERLPADERHRVRLALNALVVDTGTSRILVDPGIGVHRDDVFVDRFGVEHPPVLWDGLAAAGIGPDSIDFVVNSHLHFDHAGANVRPVGAQVAGDAGELALAFPRARYVVQRAEWNEIGSLHERNRASYRPEDYRLLETSGRLVLVDGEYELTRGVRVLPAPGHTRGHQLLAVTSAGETFLFLADLVPTRHHLDYPWVMAYDLYPVETLAEKRRLLPRAAHGEWLLGLYHDVEHAFGRVQLDGPPNRQRPIFVPA